MHTSPTPTHRIRVVPTEFDRQRSPLACGLNCGRYGQCKKATNTTFTVTFDVEKYPFVQPIPDYLLKVESVMGFDAKNWRMAHDPVDIYTTAAPFAVSLSGNLLTVHGGGTSSNIKVGDWYVLRHKVYGPGGFATSHCSNISAEDVQLWSTPGMGFLNEQTEDVNLKNCGVRWRPGRPMSITADASHFNECSGHVHLNGVHL